MSRPFIPAPQVARAEIVFQYGGQVVENVYHFKADSPIDLASLSTLAGALATWWHDNFPGYFVSGNKMLKVITTALDDQYAPQFVFAPSSGYEGTVLTASQLPGNCTAAVTLYTAKRGRSYRGRIFHVGLLEAHVTDNYVNGLMAIELFEKYHKLIEEPFGVNGWTLGVLSYYTEGAWRMTADFNACTSIVFSDLIDNQRRRLTGRGR